MSPTAIRVTAGITLLGLGAGLMLELIQEAAARFLPEWAVPWFPWLVAGALIVAGFSVLTWGRLFQKKKTGRKGQAKRRTVAAHLRSYRDELDQLYQQAKHGPAERARERADEALTLWKQRALEYLDAAIGYEDAMQFYELGAPHQLTGIPGAHVSRSYEAHRDHLERRAAEVELGELRIKSPPRRSGNPIPRVESFVGKPLVTSRTGQRRDRG